MNMREQVARALLEHGLGQGAWEQAVDLTRDAYLAAADAALDAMREPTEAMVIGARSRYPDGDNSGPTLYHDIFRAMIRAAKER